MTSPSLLARVWQGLVLIAQIATAKPYSVQAFVWRPESWVEPADAIATLNAAKARNLKLLGFDAAYLRGDSTQPSLEDSWDYGNGAWPEVTDPYAHAIQFIEARADKGLNFQVLFEIPTHHGRA